MGDNGGWRAAVNGGAVAGETLNVNLFELGQKHFAAFIAEFAGYGIQADPGLELRQGTGLLCYYSLEDRHIYLSVPDFNNPTGKLQALFLRSLLGCTDNEELLRFFELLIPHVIAHELAHHYRHRYGMFGDSLWNEEQIANKLAVAVVKHRLAPQEKAYARDFLRRAIETLSAKMEAKNIALDSYYSVLHALNVSGQIGLADFENIEMIQTALGATPEQMLPGSGQLSVELAQRLEHRYNLIEDIDEQYAADQIKYIYYHVGWLYLDLTSRETEYVDEFARRYLNLRVDLLPAIQVAENPTDSAVLACFKACQDTWPHSPVAGRYFYKRYRSLLLAKLKTVELAMAAQTERLKREASLILENWNEGQTDTLDYLAQLAPPALRPLFPHLIATQFNASLEIPASLPTETDQRLWRHVIQQAEDKTAAHTLYRLGLLDQTDIYRPVPAELMLELAQRLCLVKFAPGEAVIWENERNDDVYFLIEGKLEVWVTRGNQPLKIGVINPGEVFGEIAFFTADPRYATVRAAQPSQCFVLTDTDLQLMAFEHPTIL
ncbi:MAG TPA: cyclic nucleotide-binding domain-containing protein, partial [Anaerolineae bacterium]|nr:cyclic nucleotide-binding domain-containing protein [Anaerolineae bacterium]